ncbi:MAG: type II toxin-antitoxin system PemK/MazF family toxin [Candidatus Paceibacterota bacterium]
MHKDFDSWNNQKKSIHSDGENKFYHSREMWWCSLGVNVGFEQDGTGEENQRPVLILKGFNKNVCLIVPLTTSHKKNIYNISVGVVDKKKAFAIISQIRLIDTKRLANKIGMLDKTQFETIKKAVKDLI